MSTPWDWTNHAAGPLSPPICRLFALKSVHLKTNQGKLQPVFQNATSTRPVDIALKIWVGFKNALKKPFLTSLPLATHASVKERYGRLACRTAAAAARRRYRWAFHLPVVFWRNYHESWYEPLMIHFISPNMDSPKQTVSCLQFNKTFGVGLRARLGGETCYFQARYWISSGNLPFPATVKNSATTFCLVRNP